MRRLDPPGVAGSNDDPRYIALAHCLGLATRQQGPWAVVGHTNRVQGWKLHLSSIPIEAGSLLERVLPFLLEEHVSFKFARTPWLLGALNEGSLGDLQVGKFITIYPDSDPQAHRLAQRLVGETVGFHGPVVATDLRLGDVTYTRYGSFSPRILQNRLGQPYPAIYDSSNRLRPDSYTVPFEPPQGIPNPFLDLIDATGDREPDLDGTAQSGASRRLFGPGYLPLSVLKTNPKGSVFLALDLRAQANAGLCVLKQGRQFCLSDRLGRDIRSRLRHQAFLSRALSSIIPTPAAGDYFEVNGHGYLPLGYVEGVTLLDYAIAAGTNRPWTSLLARDQIRLLSVMHTLVQHLGAMHQAGFVHRDLSPTNVLVRDPLGVSLIDLELAHAIGDSARPFGKGTPGYMSPEQEAGTEATPSQDAFGFGCLLALVLCGCDPRLVLTETSRKLASRLKALSGGADATLVETAARCLERSPSRRPHMPEIEECLAWALDAASGARQQNGQGSGIARYLSDQRHLECAIQKGVRGLLSDAARDPETGLWLSPSGDTDSASGASRSFELRRDAHHGIAGVVYAIARLVRLGHIDSNAVPDVARAVKWLLTNKPTHSPHLPGLYFGEAGIAVALLEAKLAGFPIDAVEIGSILLPALGAPIDWFDVTHGAAGQGIAAMVCEPWLLHSGEALGRFAARLVEAQEEDGSWRVPAGVDGLSGQTLSGFAHGCAGIVYFLAACASRPGMSDVEQASRRGAQWLLNNALETDEGTLEWPYSDALAERWKWWCHGSPGIALAFLRLFRSTGDGMYADAAVKALKVHTEDPRATNLSVCHGLSGLGEVYLEAEAVLGHRQWLRRAEAIAHTLLVVSQPTSEGHLKWLVEDPYTPTADLMVGAAGVLHFLGHLHSRLYASGAGLSFPLLLPP
jgi:serine/threonine protein kinase